MKIVHICLCDPYNEKWSYHRNIISEQNKADGHEVYIITNSYEMDIYGGFGRKLVGEYRTELGINIIRLGHKYILPSSIQNKINTVKDLYSSLVRIAPDIIMVHNVQTFNLKDIIKYKKRNKKVILLGDSHAAYCNSARNKISMWYQKYIFAPVIRKYVPLFDEFYFIAKENYYFFSEVYGVNFDKIQIEPLPARFISREEKRKNRKNVRKELKLTEELLFVHSGKMNKEKKTLQIINTLLSRNERFKLVLIGSLSKEIEKQVLKVCKNDDRVEYLGWLDSWKLAKYISAADLYLQPGSQSITLQNSLAAGTPALIFPHAEYKRFFNGWEFCAKADKDMQIIFDEIFSQPEILEQKIDKAYETARQFFDCSRFAKKMYSMCEVQNCMEDK